MISPRSGYSYIYNSGKIYTTCFTLATKKYIISPKYAESIRIRIIISVFAA